jgi:hypothetical protein
VKFPTTKIGGIELSRLLIGSNPFGGFSHFSNARDEWLKKYFSVERIVEVLATCSARGLNGFVSGVVPKFYDALRMHEDQTGRKLHWIITPGGGSMIAETIEEEIDWCAKHGGEFILPHPCWSDVRLVPSKNEIIGFDDIIKRIRGLGLIPGVSTHRPETVVVCDRRPYDVETYIQILNPIGFLMTLETDWCARVIQQADHPTICIKPLAAGRVLPPTGFKFAYDNCKAVDTVAAGFMSPEEANEDIDICLEILTGAKREEKLQVTRSKRAVMKPPRSEAGDSRGREAAGR